MDFATTTTGKGAIPMSVTDFVHWLERFKPLWDFLVGIGTVGAVVVSLWLASRKPKAHLTLSVQIRGNDLIDLTATNDSDLDTVVQQLQWRAHCIRGSGKLNMGVYPFSLNNQHAMTITTGFGTVTVPHISCSKMP